MFSYIRPRKIASSLVTQQWKYQQKNNLRNKSKITNNYHSTSISSNDNNLATSKNDNTRTVNEKKINKRLPIRPYPTSKQKRVSKDLGIEFPTYADTGYVAPYRSPDPILHKEIAIDKLRKAGRLAREILDKTCSLAVEGITTDEINDIIHAEILKRGAFPSPLNYSGFPKSICSSVNEVICHGIPDSRPLVKGDVVSFDISCFYNGVHGDNCATVIVGNDSNNAEEMLPQKRLVQCTKESLQEAVKVCGSPGANLRDVGAAIHNVCDWYGYDTVKEYRGHGISSYFHIPPFVKHYRNDDDIPLKPGMIFTIEPMITQGSAECVIWNDQWTVMTADRGLAAQFEHMVLITDDGVEVLTQVD